MKRQRKTFTRKVSLIVYGSYLVISGLAYTPTPKPKPSREFITKTYYRPTGGERARASEQRKIAILAEIRVIRKQIRSQAERYALHEKKAINYGRDNELAYKLLMNIVNSKV